MTRSRRLVVALGLNIALVVGQLVFGVVSGSVGLLADAGHNLADAAAVVIALIAVRFSRRPPTGSAGRSEGTLAPVHRAGTEGGSTVWKIQLRLN